jgi:hypothetical protein
MDQPVPKVSADDVIRIVRRDFSPDQCDAVLAILGEYGPDSEQWGGQRVRLAILKLADGSLDAVRRNVEIAKLDYRDVLAPAEYPTYIKLGFSEIAAKSEPEEQRIIQSDWDQYQLWLHKE